MTPTHDPAALAVALGHTPHPGECWHVVQLGLDIATGAAPVTVVGLACEQDDEDLPVYVADVMVNGRWVDPTQFFRAEQCDCWDATAQRLVRETQRANRRLADEDRAMTDVIFREAA